MSRRDLRIRVGTKEPTTLSYTDKELSIANGRATQVPLRQVIGVQRSGRSLEISYIGRKKTADPLSLTKLVGTAEDAEDDIVDAWVTTLLHLAYEGMGVKRGRRLKVVINPHGGTKKGVATFNKTVEPILRAAGCSLDVIHTTRPGHAYEISKTMSLDYDVMVIVSGDGLIHEVLNGFAHHEQPINAFRIPLAPVPTGTGNGLSLNILGMADGFDVCAAALNIVKGLPMKIDVLSFTQNGKRTISFMSQALGLAADLDIGTDHLRWMGESRFMFGFLRGLIQFKPCPIELSYKVAELDKEKMFDALQKRRIKDTAKDATDPQALHEPGTESTALPPLKYSATDEGWTVVTEPLLYVYAGKGPYVGRDLMTFPVSLPDDGLIDIAAQPVSSRSDVLSNLGGAPKGEHYWRPNLKYIKAHAYRVKPLAPKGAVAVDGEVFPLEEFQVEAHRGLATLLSPYGYYAAEPPPRPT
ncbi:ATP-NAD kinase-like domain-containing protein [Mycena albidolilacea]|uniref:ATP-NAD kinase-like domain-containing protein n=1 Tax=Mycena albidolilacea TaxID=1033008 RepID=A0AAD7EQ75_9AGAR|nr:ATP-NAD kinase-like domain-containing protein [Mycena albidolilacea]